MPVERFPDMVLIMAKGMVLKDKNTDQRFHPVVFVAVCEEKQKAEQIASDLIGLPERIG